MDDIKKTELWKQMVSKHTAEAKAAAESAGNVAKEATTDGAASGTPAAGSEAPATTPTPEGDQLVALTKRLDDLEAKLGEIGKSIETVIAKATEIADAAVAKAASEQAAAQAAAQATAKAELDKTIASAQALVNDAKAAAERIEALAPRGNGKRIDEIVAKGKDALAAKTEPELLAENAPKVLKMAEGAK